MKKHAKAKTSSKKSKTAKNELPELVTVMLKIAERLDVLEKKTDMVLSRVSNLPTEMRRAIQDLQPSQTSYRPQQGPRPDQGPQQNHGPRERILYQAVCADCCKRCEVPFKPSGDRPVYCPECFAIRKAGHVPKDPTAHVVVPQHLREVKTAPHGEGKVAVAPKSKKPASKTAQKPAKKKKK